MAFIDARLNKNYLYGFSGGPDWRTLTNELKSGRQIRRKLRLMPKHRYTTNYATLSKPEQDDLLSAFMVAAGAFASFRFRDWNDYRAVDQLIGVGDGTTNPLQLVRNYTFGGQIFTRPITLPINPVIRDEDGAIIPATVGAQTGLATPDSGWPEGKALYWSGEFDVRAHFADDFNPFTAVGGNVRECMVAVEETRD